MAFPEKSGKEIGQIAYKAYFSFALTLAEIMCIPFQTAEKIKSWVSCPKLHLVKEKFEENKGVIFLTAHFGNWELGACSIGAQLGVPVYVVYKPQRNVFVGDWINMMREKFGNKTVPLGLSIRNIFKALVEKKIIGLVGDQRGEPDGPRVKFMGIDSSVYPGAAVMALKTKSPIAVAVTERQADYSYYVDINFIDIDECKGTTEEKVMQINQQYHNILEACIRRNPEQWLWMHKRWKY